MKKIPGDEGLQPLITYLDGIIEPNGTQKASVVTGIKQNDPTSDVQIMVVYMVSSIVVMFCCFMALVCLRRRFPEKYKQNEMAGIAPINLPDEYLGLLRAFMVTTDQAQQSMGLDSAMFLEFCDLCMRLLIAIGAPLILLLGPLTHFLEDHSDIDDPFALGGVLAMPPQSRMVWAHVISVWYVVIVSETMILHAHDKFLARRFEWLRAMPPPRATTVLVQGIPPSQQTDEGLRDYFSSMFSSDKIAEAFVVKRTGKLTSLQKKLAHMQSKLDEEIAKEEAQAAGDAQTASVEPAAVTTARKLRDEVATEVEYERQCVLKEAQDGSPKVFSSNGFVTFCAPREAAVALHLTFKPRREDMSVRLPPEPTDVNYEDLGTDVQYKLASETLGRCFTVFVFISVMPASVVIMTATSLEALEHVAPSVAAWISQHKMLESVVFGFLPTLLVQLVVSYVPTVFMLILGKFHRMLSRAWAQRTLQHYYYAFQILFVLLATCVDIVLPRTIKTVLESPRAVMPMLASELPAASHFYVNFMFLQCIIHASNLTRYPELAMYLGYCKIYDKEKARMQSEPEDQDYHGVGARSARLSLYIAIGITLCNVCPIITACTLINIACCRFVYGYLVIFAETRKPDLGGEFWVAQLHHLQSALIIYILLMMGIFEKFRPHFGPSPTTAVFPTLLYAIHCWGNQRHMDWENLPFEEVVLHGHAHEKEAKTAFASRYAQPELMATAT